MGKPIYILAGQSNASAISDTLQETLDNKHGVNGYVLVEAHSPGAPLTHKRSKPDWADPDEMQKVLHDTTVATLNDNPSSKIVGLIWLQGEADTYDIARANEYENRLGDLFNGFRNTVEEAAGSRETGVGTAEFIISSLSTNAPKAQDRSHWDEILENQKAAATNTVNVSLVNPDEIALANTIPGEDMFKDSLHYSEMFQIFLANALVSAIWINGDDSGKAVVRGTNGDDLLNGEAGSNKMIGGRGNDTYYVNHDGDTIVELKGEGFDHVIASTTLTLRHHSQHLETLTLVGTNNINGTGNRLNNIINGNSGDNILDGGRGRDALTGGKGHDILRGGGGQDVFVFSPGDMVAFNGKNHAEMDRILDFEIGKDIIRLEEYNASGLSDLKMWADPANNQFVIKVFETGDRIVLDGLYSWAEMYDENNFVFL